MQSDIFTAVRNAMLLGTAAVAMVGTAQAAETSVQFNIKAQSLDAALKQFALKTNKDLLYSPNIVANRRAAKLSGRFTPQQALQRLLQGSGLTYREVSPNVFALSAKKLAKRSIALNLPQVASAPQSKKAETISAEDAANTGAVSGTAVDASTGLALPGALIRVQGTKLETVTDERGQYYFPAVPRGQRTLELDYLGSKAQTVSVNVTAGLRVSANFLSGSEDTSDIVVYGFRSSTQRALNQQKNADNNATIVSSDLLGGFPAETVSEALRRVPGVAFGRDDATGEGSRITVRGFSSEAINVQLNGLELQGTGFQRTVDLSGFLTDNISEIRIQKSLLPSHESSGSGGLVEIETKSGLDYGDFSFNFGIEGETNFDRKFGEEFQAGGTIAAKITDNFGVAASLQYRKTNRVNYDVAITGTATPILPAGITSTFRVLPPQQFPFDAGVTNRLITGAAYSRRTRNEENLVGSINLAWDVGTHTKLRLDLQRNSSNSLTEQSRSLVNFRTRGLDIPVPEVGGEVRRRTTITGFAPFVGLAVRDQEFYSNSISLRGETLLDKWAFNYKLGYSRAVSKSNNVNVSAGGNLVNGLTGIVNPATLVTNPDDDTAMTPRVVDGVMTLLPNGIPVPSLTAAGLAVFNDPNQYNITSASRTATDSPTDAYFAEASVRYEAAGFIDYLEVGGKYDRSDRAAADERFANSTVGFLKPSVNYSRIFGRNTSAETIATGLFDFPTLAPIGGNNAFTFPSLTARSVDTIFNRLAGLTTDDPATAFNEQRYRFTDASTLDPINDTGGLIPAKSKEERLAGYIQAKLKFGKFDLIGGVRMERVNRSGTTLTAPSIRLNLPGVQREPRATFIAAGLVKFVDVSGTTTTWTPSAVLNYRPIDNLVARFAYFRSTVNPDFRLIRSTNNISIDLRTNNGSVNLREANPDLRPSTTDNFDFDVSYYFEDSPGLVRAGFFYKKISNNFTNVFFQNTANNSVRDRVIAALGPLATSRPDLINFAPNTTFTLNRPENGDGGVIWGAEFEIIRQLTFLPGFLKDFGILGNVTYTNGDFPTLVSGFNAAGQFTQFSLDRPLADQAAWVYNASLNYAKKGFEGRLIYTRQSQTVTRYTRIDVNNIIPAYDTLDLRLSYTFERAGGNWTVFLEGDDLLRGSKKPDLRGALGPTPGRSDAGFFYPTTLQFNGGRAVTFGVRGKF